ncbi:hypothetical protein POM88_007299 [Heracleum sosnowskyi]|uniref:Uncharacterized protein n=1 Tax=Heracleum sosnowskyi TaxID=360622 RepID=A0AAD8J778_9APIA|nr:hypothetical protein POM88_007299 [Heracleum sosnowskyi]
MIITLYNVTVSAALPPLSSTPGVSIAHNIDIGSSLPPISSSLPYPFGDLAPPESADQAPSESVTPVISYNLSSAAEQLSKNHIWVKSRCIAYNLGTGRGTSVLEMVAAFEKASGKSVSFLVFNAARIGSRAKYGADEMCRNQWKCLILPLI